jgi:mono/diheme cytochrome c family protein
LFALAALPLAAQSAVTDSMPDSTGRAQTYPGERLGTVSFAVSCSMKVRAPFSRGVALLHDFWYEEAQRQFEQIAKADPSCPMAHWGIAMSVFHQIWDRPDESAAARGRSEMQAAARLRPAKTARERSIALRSRDVQVPDLADAKKIAAGASEYAEMCTGCHLAPGMEDNELRPGLYPYPPNLSAHRSGIDADPLAVNQSAARQFWIIKHGIKLSAMPAWGKTHDDELIWDMVAFLRAMPKMSPEQYKAVVASAPEDHDEMMKDMHGMAGAHAKPEVAPEHSH